MTAGTPVRAVHEFTALSITTTLLVITSAGNTLIDPSNGAMDTGLRTSQYWILIEAIG